MTKTKDLHGFKRLSSIETSEYLLEVVQCVCGFHIGLDVTYLDQVGDLEVHCPACKRYFYTEEVCPE